jgi:phosphocarrier protein FPr
LGRNSAPTEDEQFESYKAVAEALGPDLPLTIRTLDVGGDKALNYLSLPVEDIPFLGERGIRIGLDRPEILRAQIRAILRASKFGKVRIMFPMVGRLEELRDAKSIVNEEAASLSLPPVPVGIMVEIPGTALMAAQFAKEADFFSVGTNDLAQYTLAMDRGHPRLGPHVDGLHPAVLRLIAQSVNGAHSQGKRVGVCGGIAGDAHAVPILVGLGVDELSVSLPAIAVVKAQVRSLKLSDCMELAKRALETGTATEVRALVSDNA